MKSLFSPIMDSDGGASNPTNANDVVETISHSSVILRNMILAIGKWVLMLGQGVFCTGVLYFSRQLCFFSAEISRILIVMFKL